MEDNFELDDTVESPEMKEVKLPNRRKKASTENNEKQEVKSNEENFISPLVNERVIVRFIPKKSGLVPNDKRHVLYGGMAETAVRIYTVPLLKNGAFVNVLTNSEKLFLEEYMGLERNALSVYNRKSNPLKNIEGNNFWENYQVRLQKQDNYLDLSNPDDYIKYKILLANKDLIAPNIQALQDMPKATYQYVIVREADESKALESDATATIQSAMEFGKIESDRDILRIVIETLDGRPTSPEVKLDQLKKKALEFIKNNPKMFLKVVKDDLLPAKVIIKKSVENGLIAARGNYYYLVDGNLPLCENGENPTFNVAAKFLNAPAHQEIKFTLEAKLK